MFAFWICQPFSYCSVMREIVAINTNFFFPVAVWVQEKTFFTYRAAKMWNDLPADTADFSNFNSFKCYLNSIF